MEITPIHQNISGATQSVVSQAGSSNPKPSGNVSPHATSSASQQSVGVPEQLSNNAESQVEHATEVANRFMDSASLNLQFSVDRDVNKVVVKVVDTVTHEVIKQFPSEEMLAISKALDKLQGLLIKTHA
jgi:flagellar protein FlaG